MKKILFGIIIVGAIFYFVQPPNVVRDDAPKKYTQVEQKLELKENSRTVYDRIERLTHFKEEVTTALNERVKPSEYVPDEEIPEVVKEALIAVEDKRFMSHPGVDIYGVFRAFYVNSLSGETVEGGSTITQQLVKNLFLTADRTWTRKAEELVLALMMEHYYTKDQILGMYLNSVYYGNNYYGLREASEGYFKVDPRQINLAQAALLAGLPQAPTFYNPIENPVAATAKREIVLNLMLNQNMITKKQYEIAKGAPLIYRKQVVAKPVVAKAS